MAGRSTRGVILVSCGTVAYSLSQWFQLIILVRYASVEAVGAFALALAISAPAFMFSNLRLRFLLATSTDGHKHFRYFRLVRLLTVLLAGVAVLVVGAAIQAPATVVALVALIKAIEAVSDIHQGLFQQQEAFELLATSQTAAAACLLVGCFVGISTFGTLESALLGMLIGRALVVLFIDGYAVRRFYRKKQEALSLGSRRQFMKSLVIAGLPLGFVALLVSLNANIPRYFVEGYLGVTSLGYFASIVYIPAAGYLLAGAIGQVSMQRMAIAVSDRDRVALTRILFRLCGAGLVLGLIGIFVASVFGESLLRLIYGEEFEGLARLFTIVMIAGALSYIVVQIVYILTSLRALRGQLGIYVADAIVLCLFCVWLMPDLGLIGAGYAMIVSQSVQLFIAATLVVYAMRRHFESGTRDQ